MDFTNEIEGIEKELLETHNQMGFLILINILIYELLFENIFFKIIIIIKFKQNYFFLFKNY